MTHDPAFQDIRSYRQSRVAFWRTQGLTILQIVSALSEEDGILNPDTQRPFTKDTISADLKIIRQEWHDEQQVSARIMHAELYEQISSLAAAAQARGDLSTALRAYTQLAAMVGANAPMKIANTDAQGNDLAPKDPKAELANLLGLDAETLTEL